RGLEEAYDAPESFRAFCGKAALGSRLSALGRTGKRQDAWPLSHRAESREPRAESRLVDDAFADRLSPDWIWQDPFADCSYSVQQGLVIHAANGRDLGGLNRSGPRLVRPVGHTRSGSRGFA